MHLTVAVKIEKKLFSLTGMCHKGVQNRKYREVADLCSSI